MFEVDYSVAFMFSYSTSVKSRMKEEKQTNEENVKRLTRIQIIQLYFFPMTRDNVTMFPLC